MIGALLVGATGLALGFYAPLKLSPESDQGPLFGLCMSGPLAVAAGAFFGQFADRHGWTKTQFAAGLLALVLLTACLTVLASSPPPQFKGSVIDAEIVGCAPTDNYPTPMVEVRVHGRWSIFEERKPWNLGHLFAKRDMPDLNRQYIAEIPECDPYRVGTRQLYSTTPASLKFGTAGNADVLGPVPSAFRATLGR